MRIVKPTTFMNLSGRAVAAVARFFAIAPEEILVVHDELDLRAGEAKMKFGGGPRGPQRAARHPGAVGLAPTSGGCASASGIRAIRS